MAPTAALWLAVMSLRLHPHFLAPRTYRCFLYTSLLLAVAAAGCRTPGGTRRSADDAAYAIIRNQGEGLIPGAETFAAEPPSVTLLRRLLLDQQLQQSDPASQGSDYVERIPEWPEAAPVPVTTPSNAPPLPPRLTLLNALQIAAHESREYQTQKEAVYVAALRLDLEQDAFRRTWAGVVDALLSTAGGDEGSVSGVEAGAGLGLERRFKTGGVFALDLGVDLARLLTQDGVSALGVIADATLSIPLLRGSGRFVVTEPLTQAERNVIYALHTFAQFRRTFAVSVASDYYGVLDQLSQVQTSRDSYERLARSTARAQRQAQAGRLPEIQVDQVRQDELNARNSWVSARLRHERQLDAFKVSLGLPADARVELVTEELELLRQRATPLIKSAQALAMGPGRVAPATDQGTTQADVEVLGTRGPMEIPPEQAVDLALAHRLDLRTAIGRILDAQRAVAVSADQLRADLSLLGRASVGESRTLSGAGAGNASFNAGDGRYAAGFNLDLPFERTAERNAYRASLIDFEQSVRAVQELEDNVKLSVRDDLRTLEGSRATVAIQAMSVEVAERRLASTSMFMEAGRAETRDVLEAEQSLVTAQNALTSAMVSYRIGELQLQRDMGVLEIDADGLWHEFDPNQPTGNPNDGSMD